MRRNEGKEEGRGGGNPPLSRSAGSRRTRIAFTHSGNGSADAAAGNGGRSEGSWFGDGLDDSGTEHVWGRIVGLMLVRSEAKSSSNQDSKGP